MATPRIAWILGAGFSRALGGPLLDDLFAMGRAVDLEITYGLKNRDVRHFFHYGMRFRKAPEYGQNGLDLWSDAEEFLDRLDSAVAGGQTSVAYRVLQKHFWKSKSGAGLSGREDPNALVDLRFAARKCLAAECSTFLLDADPKSERWQPYQNWFDSLGEHDTLVTFNYDTVIEALDKNGAKLDLALTSGQPAKRKTELIKLHGSVDWKFAGDKIEVADPDFAVRCTNQDELAIATPGPTKSALVAKLQPLWDRAMKTIKRADQVIFVGYRFPPTDAESRRRLLDAIRANDVSHLDCRIILAADRGDPKVERLCGLLAFALERRDVRFLGADQRPPGGKRKLGANVFVHPMGAEDFLSVFPHP